MLEEISISLHACMSIHRYIPKYFHTIYIHMMFLKNILVKLLHFVCTMCRLNGTHYHSLIHSYIYIYMNHLHGLVRRSNVVIVNTV